MLALPQEAATTTAAAAAATRGRSCRRRAPLTLPILTSETNGQQTTGRQMTDPPTDGPTDTTRIESAYQPRITTARSPVEIRHSRCFEEKNSSIM